MASPASDRPTPADPDAPNDPAEPSPSASTADSDTERPAGERRWWRRLWEERRREVLVTAAVLVLGTVALVLLLGGGSEETSGAPQGPDTLRAEGFVVQPTNLTDRIFTTGTLRANEGVELTAEAAGKVTQIRFREGDRVQRGQALVALGTDDLQAERRQLQSQLQVEQRRAEREEALLERGGVSAQDYEETAGQVEVLRAQIDRVEAEIEKHLIRAPFSGTVGLRYVSPGSYVSPGQRLASLRDLTPIKIDLSVPARYARRLRVGDPIRFRIEGADRAFRAEIYAIEPSVAEDTRAVQLRARAPNESRTLRPGAFAEVEVIFEELTDALVVPSIAVLPEQDRRRVFVARRGKAEERPVQTGIRTDSTVQITSGLAQQDTVLVSGLQSVRPGAPVRIDTLVGGSARSGIGGLKRAPEAGAGLPVGGGG